MTLYDSILNHPRLRQVTWLGIFGYVALVLIAIVLLAACGAKAMDAREQIYLANQEHGGMPANERWGM